ncbi:Uncharacterized protein QJS10_CPA03g02336 [Acorus calamus]|uniref:Uncharacterized protein n=1 Tax=Acorus calamus TaxID=4465 RepID=A0AAV9F595_ACOCL|nr:Uncharacterized protein QJS10_CPA03g02336 [Acorus calamus]
MEKPTKGRGNLLKFLPKATSFSFPNAPPFSPGREKRHNRGFSGPIISIIPAEARRNPRHGGAVGSSFDGFQEPTSPKVSCIGQIKHKKKLSKSKSKSKSHLPPSAAPAAAAADKPKPTSAIKRMFRGPSSKKPPVPPPAVVSAAPPLGNMRRFASGRDTLAGFDWRAHAGDVGGWRSDGDDEEKEEEEEEDFRVPHSAPIVMGSGGGGAFEAKKEVNIWKRRTLAPPRPLQLKPL